MAITQPQPSLASALVTGAVIGFVVIFAIMCTALLLTGRRPCGPPWVSVSS